MKNIKIFSIVALSLFLFACTDDSDDSVKPGVNITLNEEELITSVELHFADTNQVALDTFAFNDPDGNGGMSPTIDSIKINSNQSYLVNVQFLDKSNPSSIKDITAEIIAEDDEHIICYELSNANGLMINRTDSDGSYEVGIKTRWIANNMAATSNGVLKLILKHQSGSKDGSCNPGDTDVEVNFPLIIQ